MKSAGLAALHSRDYQKPEAAQHTPGKWQAVLDPCPTTDNRWIVEKRGNGWKAFICEVYGDPSHTGGPEWQGTKEANARLIASAPDMVADLLALRRDNERLRGACQTGLKVALAWGMDCNPHIDLKRGESADFDAACDLADMFRAALAQTGGGK